MGQYYKFIILDNNNNIILYINPHDFYQGAKLIENCYIDNMIMNTVEFLIGPYCDEFHKSNIVWAGDYADPEEDDSQNLYHIASNYQSFKSVYKNIDLRYIVNHTKKLYIDKKKLDNQIHPLPLLICEGNGRGSGDYDGNDSELCGTWARDLISMEFEKPSEYTELICNFE